MVFGVLVRIFAALAPCMFGRLLCQASIRSILPGEPDCGVALAWLGLQATFQYYFYVSIITAFTSHIIFYLSSG
jgi:hypothetical protein